MKTATFLLLLAVLCLHAAAQSAAPQLDAKAAKAEKEIGELHAKIRTAAVAHDRPALERYYADGYIFVHSTGEIDPKADWITKSLTITDQPIVPPQDPVFFELLKDAAVRTAKANLPNGSAIWWTRVYVKTKGQWQILREHGSAVPAPRKEVAVSADALDHLTGSYEFENGTVITVDRKGDSLFAHNPTRPEVQLISESDTTFHVPGGGAVYTFFKDQNGQITHFILKRANGQELRANRKAK